MRYIHTTIALKDHIVLLFVWQDYEAYQKATGSTGDACFLAIEPNSNIGEIQPDYYPYVGSIHLVKYRSTAGLVAHEINHAVLHLLSLLKADNPVNEELHSELIQEATDNFYKWLEDDPRAFQWLVDFEL